MKQIFFSGHRSFENHGCEAIIRSTVQRIRHFFPQTNFIVPSNNVDRDREFWPDHADYGVKLLDCLQPTPAMRILTQAKKYIPSLNQTYSPHLISSLARAHIDESDLVLAVGGDNYSDDYSLPFLPTTLDRYALSREKPVYLWGASVGPFDRRPQYERYIAWHLSRFAGVLVRERLSLAYCTDSLQLRNVRLVADPAFQLAPVPLPVGIEENLPPLEEAILVNVSPLILRRLGGQSGRFLGALAEGLADVAGATGSRLILLPHVMAYASSNRDSVALEALGSELDRLNQPWNFIRKPLNAAQIKQLISKSRALIAARTHATIAAMSQGVPVVSIGYSIKAVGINDAVFGHRDYVLDYRHLNRDGVASALSLAIDAGSYSEHEYVRSQRRLADDAVGLLNDHLVRERESVT